MDIQRVSAFAPAPAFRSLTEFPASIQQRPGGLSPSPRCEVLDQVDVSMPRHHWTAPGEFADEDRVWPGRMRRLGRAKLRHWGLDCLTDDVTLALTELINNAFEHGHGPEVKFRLYRTLKHVRIEVQDGSPKRPLVRQSGSLGEDGRGLLLVVSIADTWGVSEDGTCTWCTILTTERSA
ncbi:ATP-binding protein [Streptomyces sp. 21So2-11]|uniref:ATP-binding protein n=1 Tax=Streptomyces sp. 21So2-11 TaxID=3144408 RepID=UPI00321B2296